MCQLVLQLFFDIRADHYQYLGVRATYLLNVGFKNSESLILYN